jgi:hypothetical protein
MFTLVVTCSPVQDPAGGMLWVVASVPRFTANRRHLSPKHRAGNRRFLFGGVQAAPIGPDVATLYNRLCSLCGYVKSNAHDGMLRVFAAVPRWWKQSVLVATSRSARRHLLISGVPGLLARAGYCRFFDSTSSPFRDSTSTISGSNGEALRDYAHFG